MALSCTSHHAHSPTERPSRAQRRRTTSYSLENGLETSPKTEGQAYLVSTTSLPNHPSARITVLCTVANRLSASRAVGSRRDLRSEQAILVPPCQLFRRQVQHHQSLVRQDRLVLDHACLRGTAPHDPTTNSKQTEALQAVLDQICYRHNSLDTSHSMVLRCTNNRPWLHRHWRSLRSAYG